MFAKNASILMLCLTVLLMNACVSTKDSTAIAEPVEEENPNSIERVLADDDKDGVANYLDREKDTPEGATVNSHGETLDSDGDNIPDYLDKEPFSPHGAMIDEDGVSIVPYEFVTKEELQRLADKNDWGSPKPLPCACKNETIHYLPTLVFDIGSSKVATHHLIALNRVAAVMKDHPELAVVVEGHANGIGKEETNLKLSYKRAKSTVDYLVKNYGINQSRFIVRYEGEHQPLEGTDTNLAVNCRVEIRVSKNGELAMEAPSRY